MGVESAPRRRKHDFSSSEDEVPTRAIQPHAMQTRRRVGQVSNHIRRRLSFSESPPAREKKQQKAVNDNNTPKKFKKNKAADRADDSGISSAATSPATPESFSQHRWRQLSPELTCSSDSDASLKELPEAIAAPKNRRSCAGQKRGRKAAGEAPDTTPLRGGKRRKAEAVQTKKPARGPGKRKQEKSSEAPDSPARKITRQTSSRRRQRSPEEKEKPQDDFSLKIVDEEPLDGRSWGESPEDRIEREKKLRHETKKKENDEFLVKMDIGDDDPGKISDLSDLDVELEGSLRI